MDAWYLNKLEVLMRMDNEPVRITRGKQVVITLIGQLHVKHVIILSERSLHQMTSDTFCKSNEGDRRLRSPAIRKPVWDQNPGRQWLLSGSLEPSLVPPLWGDALWGFITFDEDHDDEGRQHLRYELGFVNMQKEQISAPLF